MGKETSLQKYVHSALDFDIDVAVGVHFRSKTILFDKVRREVTELESHVFVAWHRRVEVEVLDVNRHELCAGCGHNTVEKELEC